MDLLTIEVNPALLQPLEIDCNITYQLDTNLFIGDPNQPTLMLPWQLETGERSTSPQDEITWEQAELVDILESVEDVAEQLQAEDDLDFVESLLNDASSTSTDTDDFIVYTTGTDDNSIQVLSSLPPTSDIDRKIPLVVSDCKVYEHKQLQPQVFEQIHNMRDISNELEYITCNEYRIFQKSFGDFCNI